MNPRIYQLFRDSDSRHLTVDEKQELLAYGQRLPLRLKIGVAVEKNEDAIARAVTAELQKRYPNFDRFHPEGWEHGIRDMKLVIRYNVQAMILEDMKSLEDKLLMWMRTLLAAYSMTPQFLRDTYTLLRDAFKRQLVPDAYAQLEPYLERNIEILSTVPEPAEPRV